MAIASQLMTLEDYLHYDDGTDTRYELREAEIPSRLLQETKQGARLTVSQVLLQSEPNPEISHAKEF